MICALLAARSPPHPPSHPDFEQSNSFQDLQPQQTESRSQGF